MNFRKILVIIIVLVSIQVCIAQPPGPPNNGNPPGSVPITGIEYLLAGGALLGLRKLMRSKKQSVN